MPSNFEIKAKRPRLTKEKPKQVHNPSFATINEPRHHGAKHSTLVSPLERMLHHGTKQSILADATASLALFLINRSTERIMLLGQWKCDTFLVYPTGPGMDEQHMSQDMIRHDFLIDVSGFDQADPDFI
jgi:hypothetical protein